MNWIVRFWYKLSIKNKMMLFLGVFIIGPSLFSVYSHYFGYKTMDESYVNLQNYFMVHQMKMKLYENKQHMQQYMKDANVDALEQFHSTRWEIETIMNRLRLETEHAETHIYITQKSIDSFWKSYDQESAMAVVLRQDPDIGFDFYKPFFQALTVSAYLEEEIDEMISYRFAEGNNRFVKLLEQAAAVKTIVLLGHALIILMIIGFAYAFSNYLSKPIRELAHASMQMSAGKLDVNKIKVASHDEVGILARSFNKMSANIRRLVEDLEHKAKIETKLHEEEMKNVVMQKLLNDAKFLGLQSQINPHFLFNTLNMISRTSMFEHADKTTKLIQSLSKIFRYHLDAHGKAVSLDKELDIVEEYMFIQNQRFQGRIRLELMCDPRLDPSAIFMPCFTIQPIVENGIVHGLESLEAGGRLRVKVKPGDGEVEISIIDNGVGIPPEKLAGLLVEQEQSGEERRSGIGLTNVKSRLELYFNRECLSIRSKPWFGTLVKIRIPVGQGGMGVEQAVNRRR